MFDGRRIKILRPLGGGSLLAGDSVGYDAMSTQKCLWGGINWINDYIGKRKG